MRFLGLIFSFSFISVIADVDFVVYSYDRPMQLFALLESMQKYIIEGIGEIHVIYRTSNNEYSRGYDIVKLRYKDVIFHKQGRKPQIDFKLLVLSSAFDSPNEYVSFVVDDIIVKDYFSLNKAIYYLQKTDAYCFLLRLGKNIEKCYTMKVNTPAPNSFVKVEEDVYSWVFKDGIGDWNFPNNNDMTIYKKKRIRKDLEDIDQVYFTNTFYEPYWCNKANRNLKGLCFEASKIVNICMNIVIIEQPSYHQFTEEWKSKFSDIYSLNNLLKRFLLGERFNIDELFKIKNPAPHIEYNLSFRRE